jgi:hypothetical protein
MAYPAIPVTCGHVGVIIRESESYYQKNDSWLSCARADEETRGRSLTAYVSNLARNKPQGSSIMTR